MSTEGKILAGIGIVTVIIVVAAAFLVGGKSTPEKDTKLTAEQQKVLVRDDSHIKGSKDAQVTLVEFGDFQCPACGASHPIVEQLIREYDGKVKFVFRQFPLPMHKNAKDAAYAAEAAGEQGKFFEMYDLLFRNQKDWGESNKAKDYFKEYASNLKLDMEKFEKALNDKKFEKVVNRDVADGNALGVSSTPTFFINGVQQAGGLPYNEFKDKIEKALKEAK